MCSASCSPLSVVIIHQVLHVALPGAEDEAVVVVRVRGLRTVVAVVSTSLICVTSIQASSEAVYRDQVVSGGTSTPKVTESHVLRVSDHVNSV